MALVINTGYSTQKGRVIRKILNPKVEDNELFKSITKFGLIILVVNLSLFLLSTIICSMEHQSTHKLESFSVFPAFCKVYQLLFLFSTTSDTPSFSFDSRIRI